MVPWGVTSAGARERTETARGAAGDGARSRTPPTTGNRQASDVVPGPSDERGGRSTDATDHETVTVPPTPEGVATAVSFSTAAHETTAPARSHPAFRDHPPLVELGEEVSIPWSVARARAETDLTFRLPDRLDALFVAAPLAYYLCADVEVQAGATPTLRAPSASLTYRFPELPAFQQAVADVLRKTFFLDCMVRDVAPEAPQSRDALVDALEVEPATLREWTLANRLARYLTVPDELVEPALPDWHLSTYAEPTREHVTCLPHLLDSLSLVYLPEATELDGSELLDRTLDDAYRSGANVADVDVVKPEPRAGRVRAWLAPGTPIDAFKTTPCAYENRHEYASAVGDSLSVSVVLNEEEMADERAAAADIYRRRSADLPIELTVHESLTTAELRGVLDEEHDFLHYIGHCESSGLCCADGTLSVETLQRSRTRTFFLNACGSYHEGLSLVERGSVAGAVTLTKVLDSHAAKVGTAFARLLVHGFEFERAMQLARRRILMGKDYTVVGDGTYSLLPVDDPGVVWLRRSDDRFEVTHEVVTASTSGESYASPVDDTPRLQGTVSRERLSRPELLEVLSTTSLPVIYDGSFYWSDELATQIRRAS